MPTSPQAPRVAVVGLSLWLGTLACHSTPPPSPPPGPLALPPTLEVAVEHYFGSILSGPRQPSPEEARRAASTPAHAVTIRWLALEELPAEGLEALVPHMRLVAAPDSDRSVRGTTKLAVGAGFARGAKAHELWRELREEASGRAVVVAEHDGAVPLSLTCIQRLTATELIEDPDNFLGEWPPRGPVEKELALAIGRPAGDGVQLALRLADLAPRSAQELEEGELDVPPEGGRPDGDVFQREWILPDFGPEVDEGPVLLVTPSPFATGEARAFAVFCELHSALPSPNEAGVEGDRAVELTTQLANAQLALLEAHAAAARLAAARAPVSPEAATRLAARRAYRALREAPDERGRRGPLLHLAESATAPLTRDLVLLADEQVLDRWILLLPELTEEEDPDAATLCWWLERAAWLSLAEWALRDSLPLEYQALLVRHAGELGRYPSSLEQALRESPTPAHLRARLLSENRLFLEDTGPGARVRAFDWLLREGAAPAGYDPLAPRAERKAALAAAPPSEGPR